MRVVVTVEGRFARTPDGAIWTQTGQDHQFWTGYLAAFDQVRVVARVRDTTAPASDAKRVTGPGVDVWPVPYYIGPYQYLAKRPAIGRAIHQAASDRDAVIMRVPSPIGTILAAARERRALPYALEVVGDPDDLFAPGVVDHPLRPLLRQRYVGSLRQQCRSAVCVAYVTDGYLQGRYPAGQGAISVAVSDVDLATAAYVPTPAASSRRATPAPSSPSARSSNGTKASTPSSRHSRRSSATGDDCDWYTSATAGTEANCRHTRAGAASPTGSSSPARCRPARPSASDSTPPTCSSCRRAPRVCPAR